MKSVPDAGSATPAGPGAEPEEALELTEDAIVAAQTGAHVPKPRARVAMEARSIVVADAASVAEPEGSPAGDAGVRPRPRELGAYTRAAEKTVVAQRKAGSTAPVIVTPQRKARGSRGLVIWGAAGAAAFALGGVLALASGGSSPAPAPASPTTEARATSEPAAVATEAQPPAASAEAVAPIEPASATPPLPKVNAAQLPIERPAAAPKATAKPRPPAPPKPAGPRPPSDIPEGI